jgi:type I restriction enzyme S subunit
MRLKRAVWLVNRKTVDTSRTYVGLENIEPWTGRFLAAATDQPGDGIASLFECGDVLFGKLRPYLAKVGLADSNGRCTSELLVLRSGAFYPRFLQYVLLTEPFIRSVDASTFGSKMPRADWEFIGQVVVPVPERAWQRAAVSFLDRKTAAIDALIAKKERLVELLQAKRQALIAEAVTKGLEPSVRTKPSGVEWLGSVPAHWDVTRFRRLARLQQGLQIPREERLAEPGTGREEYITIQSIHAGDDVRSREYIADAPLRGVCRPQDVLMARTGATGEVVTNVSGAFHNNFFKVSCDGAKLTRDFLVAYLSCSVIKTYLLRMAGTTTIPDLNHDEFYDAPALVPPVAEQIAICEALHTRSERVLEQERAVSKTLLLLREYRQALITAAVTGKIDVSNEAA